MIAIEKTNNTGKLLVAVLAMFMIVAGCAVALSDNVNAAEYADADALQVALDEAGDSGTVTVSNKLTINADDSIEIPEGVTLAIEGRIFLNGGTITGGTITENNSSNLVVYSGEISGVTFEDYRMAITSDSNINGDITVSDCTFASADAQAGVYIDTSGNYTISITGCDFTKGSFAQGAITFDAKTSGSSTAAVTESGSISVGIAGGEFIAGTTLTTDEDITDVIVKTNATINVPSDVTFACETITGAGSVNVMGTLDADVALDEGGKFQASPDAVVKGNVTVNGEEVSTSGSWQTLPLIDGTVIDASSSIVASSSQKVTVDGNVTVVKDGIITISGQLIINEGATLTLKEGAQVIIQGMGEVIVDGDLVIEAGTADKNTFDFSGSQMTVNGYVSLDGADSFKSSGKVTVNGTFEINDEASATLDDAVVAAGGEILVYGDVITSTGKNITNNGTITVDSESLSTGFSVLMGDAGVLDVVNAYGTITVTDADKNGLILENVSGAYVTDSVVKDKDDKDVSTLYLSGTLTYAVDAKSENVAANITATGGKVEIAENVILGTGVTLSVEGALTVSAEMTAVDGTITGTDAGELTVTGKVITKEATMTVAADDRNSGRFDTSKAAEDAVEVDGTLVLENSAKSRAADKTKILSDTYKEVGASVTFTNIYNAVENAASGETVTVSRGTTEGIVLDKDLVIGQGVTLSIPSSEKVTVDNGVTVTVDGTLASEGTYVIEEAVKASEGVKAEPAGATIVNGVFKYKTGNYEEQIVGAYFGYDGTNAIMPLTSVPAIVNDIEGNTVTLYGQMTVGDIDLSAYDGKGLTLVAKNDFTFGNITLGDVKFESPEYKVGEAGKEVNVTSVTGAIVLANGTIALDNVYGITAQNTTGSDDTVTSYVGGAVYAYDDPATEKAFETGTVSVDGAVTSNAKFNGKSDKNGDIFVTVVEGATLKVASNGADDITVEGTMVIAGADVAFKSVVVTGTVSVEESIDDATVTGTLYVGVSVETVGEKKVITDLGVDAAVDGLTLSGTSAIAYVAPGATAGDSFDGLKSTAYYKDDALYVTAYISNDVVDEDDAVNVSDITISIENAVFGGWLKEDGTPVDTTTGSTTTYGKVGADGMEKVYADIITEIYDVKITADGGIGTVAIDGVVLTKSGNTFTTNGLLAAGTYEIDYMLNSGFNGDNVKITVNGQEITGNTITLSGTPAAGETSMVISISIYGTEPVSGSGQIVVNTGSTGSDDMSLTDILLIVLVVLIVIMAVIVALRLMRS